MKKNTHKFNIGDIVRHKADNSCFGTKLLVIAVGNLYDGVKNEPIYQLSYMSQGRDAVSVSRNILIESEIELHKKDE